MSDDMSESPRPRPDFQILVQRESDTIDVTDAVMDIYDIAINSLDFGSGFLSTEEVGNLRFLGKAINAERFDYQNDLCLLCGEEYRKHNHLGSRCKKYVSSVPF